jgi:N-hydroxyarylamine O-acetyltransferase
MMHEDGSRRDDLPAPLTADPPAELPASWTARYLSLLGVEREAPSLQALTRLVRAHVLAVPFENVTALLRRRDHPTGPAPSPDPLALLGAWERRSGGGVCFDITAMVLPLLRSLGYQAYLILGHISGPFGHQAIVVHLEGHRYLVDLGNGAPLFAPIPLDGVSEVHRHGLGFRFRPSDQQPRVAGGEEWIRDRLSEDGWVQGCRYELQPAAAVDRDAGYQHHLTPGTTWVLGTLTMTRSTTEAVYSLRDDTLTQYTEGGKETTTLSDPAEYRRIATEIYGLPSLPVDEGLAVRAAFAELAAGPTPAR